LSPWQTQVVDDIIIVDDQINSGEWKAVRCDIESNMLSSVKAFRSCQDRIRAKLAENEEAA
jgi:hypothetical protein